VRPPNIRLSVVRLKVSDDFLKEPSLDRYHPCVWKDLISTVTAPVTYERFLSTSIGEVEMRGKSNNVHFLACVIELRDDER
jgi:hypothetical protein